MKKIFFSLFAFLLSTIVHGQLTCNGYWGQYLVNQTFGQGNATDNWYGPLATFAPGASTSTTFVGAAGPPGTTLADNQSGLTKNSSAPGTGQGANWVNMPDHTGDPNGLMFLINAPSTAATVFFEYTMDDLCPNTTLKLAVWVLNVNSGQVPASTCGTNTQYPDLTLRVVDPVTNAVLASAPTGLVPIDTAWHQYSVIFNNGANTSVKLQIVNNSVGSGCGNDLALDDITVQPCVPLSEVLPKLDTLVCSYTTIDFSANVVNSPYNPAEYQWQYSDDGGTTWQNAGPASASPNFNFNTQNYPIGQYLIRYLTGPTGATGNLNCAAVSDTSKVKVDSIPVVDLFEIMCEGQTFDFFGRQLSTTGLYDTVIPAVSMNCDTMYKLDLTVVPRPKEIFMHDTIIACQYDSVALESNTLPYNADYTYQWQPSTNLDRSDVPNVWFSADQSRRYVLTVTNTVGTVSCNLRDTVDVIVNPGDFLQVPITDTGICPGDTVQLAASGAHSYQWTPAIYLDDANISDPINRAEVSTVYELVGTSDKGCRDTQMVNVTVHPAAVLALPDHIDIYSGEVYHLEPPTNASYFHWFPDAGLSSTAVGNPKITPTVDTRYFVIARTDMGCEVTDSVDVRVKQTVLNTPNAFNPNHTTFKVERRGIAQLISFEIYNRWGQKVFETKNIDHGWDGTFNGVAQPMGVYVYRIIAVTDDGREYKHSANVTLIR